MCCIGDSGIGVPTISPSLGAQIPAADTTSSVSMSPWVVWTAVTRPPVDIEAGDLDVAEERRAVSLGLSRHRLGRPGRFRVDVRRDVDRSQGALGEHREEGARLGGAENVGLDAPATAVPSLSFQIGKPLRRPGHLQAAHGLGARNAVELQPRPQVDGV